MTSQVNDETNMDVGLRVAAVEMHQANGYQNYSGLSEQGRPTAWNNKCSMVPPQ